jgi:hypothetical protein
MKLFRHFRPGGSQSGMSRFGDGYAAGLIHYTSHEINDIWDESGPGAARLPGQGNTAALRRGRFQNADLPFLLARRFTGFATMSPVAATQPWPANPVSEWLSAPPPSFQPRRGTAGDWDDPDSPVHDSVFPDEAVCDHVVKFELVPRLRVTLADGRSELMDAAALNRHLGLPNGDEWPALVAPGFIEMTIATISEKAALTLTKPEDYLTGPAHPSVFDAASLDEEKMMRLANAMTLETLPPVFHLEVTAESPAPRRGIDFFEGAGRDFESLADRGMVISQVRLLSKSGGRSGDWTAS